MPRGTDAAGLFRYALGERLQPPGASWGTIIQRRYTERLSLAPFVEYFVAPDGGPAAWWFESLLAEGEQGAAP